MQEIIRGGGISRCEYFYRELFDVLGTPFLKNSEYARRRSKTHILFMRGSH